MFTVITTFLFSLLTGMTNVLDYTVDLPFKTLEQPPESIIDEGMHDIPLDFTLDLTQFDDQMDEQRLQDIVDDCLERSGASFISMTIDGYMGGMDSNGVLTIHIPPSTTLYDRNFIFTYDNGNRCVGFSQDAMVPEYTTLSSSPSSPLFPSSSDSRHVSMTGGVAGVTYSLYRDTELIAAEYCNGGTVDFGHVSTPGTYKVLRPEGYSVGNILTIPLMDVFRKGVYSATNVTIEPAPAHGGNAVITLRLDRQLSNATIDTLQTWFNNRQDKIDFWPELGQRISFSHESDNRYMIVLQCPQNISASRRTFDTGMYLLDNGQTTLKFTQEPGLEPDNETDDINYVRCDTFVGDGTQTVADITYYGGLGYPVQEVNTKFTSAGKDLVTGIVYDNMRRPDAKVLLPHSRSSSGYSHFDQDYVNTQRQYYSVHGFGDGSAACKVNTFENGASGRMTSSRREGQEYKDQNICTRFGYRLNTPGDSVTRLIYQPPTASSSAVVSTDGVHAFGKLKVVTTTDEDDNVREVFSDMDDKVILERRKDEGQNNDTYYVYDIRDSLVCVIQPMGAKSLPASFSFDSQFAQNWCFTYIYDAVGNLIEKHVPGAGTTFSAYDLRGRVVLTADQIMTQSDIYRYFIYDGLDRITEEGYVRSSTPIASFRNALAAGADAVSVIGTARIPQRVCTYYDTATLPAGFVSEQGVVDNEDVMNVRCLTMLKTEKVYEDIGYNSTTSAAALCWRERTFFYDSKGRTVQVKETGSDGWTSRYSSSYDFTGNLTSYVERHFYGSHEDCVKYVYQYDLRGRKTLARRWLNGREFTPARYVYDDLGRKAVVDCGGKVVELYSYNLQGWPQTQDVLLYGQPEAFQMTTRYYNPQDPQAEPVFGGFVSEAVSKHMGQSERTVIYRYDDLGRVVDATEVGGSTEAMEYDANGNLLAASKMNGGSSATRTYFTHSGNCLQKVTENNRPWSFTYWPNGNLKTDAKENLSFSYNFSNLLTDVRKGVTQIATITYLADGTKVKVKATGGAGLLYRGRFIYRFVLDGLPTIESVEHDHGRFLPGTSANEFIDTWHVRDYLGSTRAVFDITPDHAEDLSEVILEQNDYCLFGSRIDNADLPTLAQNRFRFNGKEKLIAGANDTKLTDYGARMYSAPLARWTTPDPLADKYYSISPYAFCNNNPVNFVDPDGNKLYFAAGVSEAFKQKFAAVVQFMNEKGTAGDLAKLDASDNVYYIKEVASANDNRFIPESKTILWAPDAIAVTEDYMQMSPATTLAHEAAHAAAYDEVKSTDNIDDDRELNRLKKTNSDAQFGTLEERRIVNGSEQIAARKHGEIREDQITRKNNKLRQPVNIPKGYTPEQVSKAVFEHNNSF